MDLDKDSRQYAKWTFKTSFDPVTDPEVEFTSGGVASAWTPLVWDGPSDEYETGKFKREARILVAGPGAPGQSAYDLALGTHETRVRITDNPEIVILSTDPITVG